MMRSLIIFAKEPEIGRVKTRLSGYLSGGQCLDLYKAFLRDTIDLSKRVKCGLKILAYDSGKVSPDYLKESARGFVFYKQRGRNLGMRMHDAFKFAKGKGARKTVIIGSDSPNLPFRFIREAFNELDKFDIALGPSLDGGYYLIGVKEPHLGLFKGIRWSKDHVFETTLKNAGDLKIKSAVLPLWYDVDSPFYLSYLKKDLSSKINKDTARWTKEALFKKVLDK